AAPAMSVAAPEAGRLDGWDAIPGARGCTPQSCGFRDHAAELAALGYRVAGLSAQPLEEQVELAERLGIVYPVAADSARGLGARLRPPIVPKKFFHTAGNFREHEEESKQVGWTHKIAPWIVFFQNVDALIGQDDPIIYPEHLTEELDYELELAVVVGKAGKHFGPEDADGYIAGYVIFNDITARDIQRREMRSGVFSFCKA